MTRRERIEAAIGRRPVDRVPYAVWRRFPAVDRSPAGLAQATLRCHERYGSDLLVLAPRDGYAVEAWGCAEADPAGPDGRRPCGRCAVREPGDWTRIRSLDPAIAPGYAEELETIVRLGFDRRLGDAPVLVTLFSPLTLAARLSGDRLAQDIMDHPGVVADALEGITETTLRFAELALAEGIAGVFYEMWTMSPLCWPEETYARFGAPHDRRVLQAVRERGGLAVAHAHGDVLAFDRLAGLPADVVSWHDRRVPPTLGEGQALVTGAVLGGLDPWRTLRDGPPEEAVRQVEEAVAWTGGVGLIAGPGCGLLVNTPDATVAAAIRALGGSLRPLPGLVG